MIRPRKNAQGKVTSYQVLVWSPLEKKKIPVGSTKTLKEARALERSAASDMADGAGTPTTVREYAAVWLKTHPRPRTSTMDVYSSDIELFVKDFGPRKLSAIRRREAREWALKQPRNRVNVVRSFFNDAIDDELVTANPFSNLRLKQSRGRKDLVVLSEAQLDELALCAYEVWEPPYAHVMHAAILFSGWVACRPGELYDVDRYPGMAMCEDGLEHPTSYVDWDEGVVYINGQRQRDGTRIHHTKNGRVRKVVLAGKVVDALNLVRQWEDEPALFYSVSGRRFKREAHYRHWDKVRNTGGYPGMDYYELRHFGATELLRQGASHADVAIHLGHTDGGALVMSTYGHPEEEAARERLRKILRPEEKAA